MSEIPELTVKVNELTASVTGWNTAIIIMMIVAALAATGLVIIQRIAFKKAELLAETQDLLNLAKDKQLAGELKNKDVLIEEAKAVAAKANERAAKLEKEAAALTESAEMERLARVKIEERLAWRRVDPTLYERFVKELTPFAGSVISLNPLGNGDPETGAFTENIAKLMRDANWKVQIATGNVQIPVPVGLICKVDDQTKAGKALMMFLKTLPCANIQLTHSLGVVAIITVGIRPPP